MMINSDLLNEVMSIAIEEAKLAYSIGEVPVGAVLALNGKIISKAHNQTALRNDPSAHAEILALRTAGESLMNWRMSDAVLCVTVEPCTMCTGAIRIARVGTVIYGASEPKTGAMGSLYDLSTDPRLGPEPRIIRGVKEDECSQLMKRFFQQTRLA